MELNQPIPADKGLRAVNSIIDTIAFLFIYFVFTFILTMSLFAMGVNTFYTDETGETFPVVALVVILPTYWLYYIITEYFFQRTLGKLLTKTRVVSKTGGKPTLKQIIFRTLSRSIPLEYLSFIVKDRGIHDSLSGTVVVQRVNTTVN